MSLDIVNADQWLRAMNRGLDEVDIESEEQVVDLARTMSKLMRDGAPEMDEEERRRRQATESGRESVRRKPGKTTIRFNRGRDRRGRYVDVGPSRGAFYFLFYEYGTSKQPARPFLRPAIEQAIARWRSG